jgi:hypothetical protein
MNSPAFQATPLNSSSLKNISLYTEFLTNLLLFRTFPAMSFLRVCPPARNFVIDGGTTGENPACAALAVVCTLKGLGL